MSAQQHDGDRQDRISRRIVLKGTTDNADLTPLAPLILGDENVSVGAHNQNQSPIRETAQVTFIGIDPFFRIWRWQSTQAIGRTGN